MILRAASAGVTGSAALMAPSETPPLRPSRPRVTSPHHGARYRCCSRSGPDHPRFVAQGRMHVRIRGAESIRGTGSTDPQTVRRAGRRGTPGNTQPGRRRGLPVCRRTRWLGPSMQHRKATDRHTPGTPSSAAWARARSPGRLPLRRREVGRGRLVWARTRPPPSAGVATVRAEPSPPPGTTRMTREMRSHTTPPDMRTWSAHDAMASSREIQ